MVDKRALKILFATYWSSNGWKRKEEQVTLPEDLLYAKQVGVMFDPIRLSHEDIVRRAIEVRGRIEPQAVADAFLASLSTRRLGLRSALGSYAVLRHLPTQCVVEMGYPACWWRGRYGIDEATLRSWFPTLEA